MESVEERFSGLTVKGNGLYAKKDFAVGDVILEETPLICCQFAWNEDCRYRCCEYCMFPLETAEENARRLSGRSDFRLPYPELDTVDRARFTSCPACGTEYCSEACKSIAIQRYHRTLCRKNDDEAQAHPLNVLKNMWKQIHFPPETFSVMILAKLAAMYLQADAKDREQLLSTLRRFQNTAVDQDQGILHKMCGSQFYMQLGTMKELFASAFPQEILQPWWTPESFISFLAMFGRNAQGVGTSALGLWQKAARKSYPEDADLERLLTKLYAAIEEKTGEEFMDNEGSALYVRQRACNHSCSPNTEISFMRNNSTLTLTAVRPISLGEEIYISYLSECDLQRSRHSRQKALREYYLFNCSCTKCQEEASQADVTSSEDEDEWEDEEEMEEE